MKLSEFIPQTGITEARAGQTDLKLPALDHTMRAAYRLRLTQKVAVWADLLDLLT